MTFLRLRTAFSDSTCMNCSNCPSICYSKIELVRGPLAALAARHPVEGVVRRGAGHVLQPDEAVVAGLLDGAEHLTPVDLPRARFMPPWVIRNLDVPNILHMPDDRLGHAIFHALHVVDIVLQLHEIRVEATYQR